MLIFYFPCDEKQRSKSEYKKLKFKVKEVEFSAKNGGPSKHFCSVAKDEPFKKFRMKSANTFC